jgi:Ca2+-binding RTX toxin-like protein
MAVAGLSERGIEKALQKTGLARVFDSLRKDSGFQDYLKKQKLQQDIGATSIAQLVDYAITSFNEKSELGIIVWEMIHGEEETEILRALEIDNLAIKYFKDIDPRFYADFTRWSSDALRNSANNLLGALTPTYNFDLSGLGTTPIGAFYDSHSQTTDTAASIADKTLTLFDAKQQGVTASQLSLLDANRDGKLTGTELKTLSAWADLNENGQVDTNEMRTLAQRGIVTISAADFGFFTQGNSRLAAAVVADPALVLKAAARVAPASNFRTLRDNVNYAAGGKEQYVFWAPQQVKINDNNRTTMVGTDGNDSFNAQYYAAYKEFFNVNVLVKFLGGGGNDTVGGSSRNDTIWGGTGDDVLLGYQGNDKLYGEDGHDQLFGDQGADTLLGGDGFDTLYGGAGDDYLDGGAHDDVLAGNEGNDRLFGGGGYDELQGNAGNDQLSGEDGKDRLFGQVGNDTLWGGDGDDILVGFTASNDTQQALLAGETDNDVIYGGNGNDYALGGVGNDTLHGEAGNDDLEGGDGDDWLSGGDGDDRLFGQVGNDVLYGGDGDDLILGFTATNEAKQRLYYGETDDDWLYGGKGRDTLLGGLGNDYLDGGAGADRMEGGQGDDTYVVNSVNDTILEFKDEGYDRVISSTNYLLNANIEELRLVEGLDIHGTGNALDNLLIGNSRDNILDGVTGADRMVGGKGNDTYYVDNAGDQTVELVNEGVDTVQASISHTLVDNLENLILLDFAKAERGMIDGQASLVYGYPKANELDYMQGDAEATFRGTCALTSIANLLTQADRPTTEGEVLQVAVDNNWTVQDPTVSPNRRGGSNFVQQQAILDSYGIRNDVISGYNEVGTANLIRSGRGVLQAVNAGALWDDPAYNDNGAANHMVTITGVVYGETDGQLLGFYIADSGRQQVSDMTRFVSLERFRQAANVAGGYAIYTLEPLKLWDEDINATGNSLNNLLVGNRGDNVLSGGAGNDTLDGQGGNDVLDGGTGNDTLTGGEGSDTYIFGRGYGQDTIVESGLSKTTADFVRFRESVGLDQLWFKRYANNLDVTIIGTSDKLTIRDWFVDESKQVEAFYTSAGDALIARKVNQLIEAMATFAPPSSGSSSLPPNYKAVLESVIASGLG